MFVAQYGLAGFEIAHAVELEPAQDAADGGPAEACGLRDAQPGPALTAQCLDPLRQLRLGGPTQAERPATTVHKSGLPQLAIACHPFGRGLRAHVGGGCGRRQRASALDHPLGHLFSTPNHRSCILVIVHLVSWITESSQTQLYRSRSDGQSIETSQLGTEGPGTEGRWDWRRGTFTAFAVGKTCNAPRSRPAGARVAARQGRWAFDADQRY